MQNVDAADNGLVNMHSSADSDYTGVVYQPNRIIVEAYGTSILFFLNVPKPSMTSARVLFDIHYYCCCHFFHFLISPIQLTGYFYMRCRFRRIKTEFHLRCTSFKHVYGLVHINNNVPISKYIR